MIDESFMQDVKVDNQTLLSAQGFSVNEHLPIITDLKFRNLDEVKGRMSVMTALVNISFRAPISIIKDWIHANRLSSFLSGWEKSILEKKNEDLSEEELNALHWYLENLWALLYVTKLIDALPANKPVENYMVTLLPNLQKGEDNRKIESIAEMRDNLVICYILDYYYRLHWYCVNARVNGKGQTRVNESIIYHRRRALEWCARDHVDWDSVPMDT